MTFDFPIKVPCCRYFIFFNAWWALLALYVIRTNISISIIAMSTVSVQNFSIECSPDPTQANLTFHPPFHWSDKEQGVILSSFFYGYICTHILSSVSSILIGARNTMLISIFGATLFTFLVVYFSTISINAVVASRVLVGFFSGPLFPCLNKIMSAWMPVHERTKILVFTNTGNIAGLLVAFGLGGVIIDINDDGWKYFFYFSGALGIMCFVFFAGFVFDDPMCHPFITTDERDYIMKSLHPTGIYPGKNKLSNVPFFSIFTSIPVYLICLSNFGSSFILFAFLTGHAKFLHDVYGISIIRASLLSMIPFSANFIFQILSSYVMNAIINLKVKSVTFWRRISGLLGFSLAAVFLIPAGFLNCNEMTGVIVLLALSMGFLGWNQSGFFTAMVDIGPQYSDVVSGLVSTFSSAAGITTPLMTGFLTSKFGRRIGWRNSFMIGACVAFVAGSFFFMFGSSEKQKWNSGRKIMKEEKKLKNNSQKELEEKKTESIIQKEISIVQRESESENTLISCESAYKLANET